ncbi:hypothetical protein STPYR_10099 [uncultured Stenotrophomonas sp.]|uniref:Uncharacterized protein n=1 Tax=uncultured Stenotrophomonas sp. TaxID=165438 RepID=A0A1Y5PYU9_9GAMM|nr:hypothetical protein STPYR_10099 [uncultured Stenotrophomonas sp.]
MHHLGDIAAHACLLFKGTDGIGHDPRALREQVLHLRIGHEGGLGRGLSFATLAVGAGMQGFSLCLLPGLDHDLRRAAQRLRQGLRQRRQRALGLQVFEARRQRQAQHAIAVADEGGIGRQFARRPGQAAGSDQVQPLLGAFQRAHGNGAALDSGRRRGNRGNRDAFDAERRRRRLANRGRHGVGRVVARLRGGGFFHPRRQVVVAAGCCRGRRRGGNRLGPGFAHAQRLGRHRGRWHTSRRGKRFGHGMHLLYRRGCGRSRRDRRGTACRRRPSTRIRAGAFRHRRHAAGRAEGQHAQHGHLETGARAGRQVQVATATQGHLVPQLHHFRAQAWREPRRVDAVAGHRGARHQLLHLDAVQRFGQRIEHAAPVRREIGQRGHHLQQPRAIARGQRIKHRRHLGTVHRTQHRAHHLVAQHATRIGDGLVQQRQAVAQRAIGAARQLRDGTFLEPDLLGAEDAGHLPADLFLVQPLQVELQATRQHGHRQLLRVGGGQQELHVFRRLLQRLQQRVERRLGQHVHLVDQVHLVLAARGHVLGVLDHLAYIVHAGVGGRVDLQQVDVAAGVDVQAGRALPARVGAGAVLAVQRLGEDAGDGGLANAAGAGEQEGVVDAAAVQRVAQRADHVFLAHQLGETLGPPLAGEDEVGHQATVFIWTVIVPVPACRCHTRAAGPVKDPVAGGDISNNGAGITAQPRADCTPATFQGLEQCKFAERV